jgi:hypothetical protein
MHPARWDVQEMLKTSVGALSAVFLGVLLNLLDALSYGMYLFGYRGRLLTRYRYDSVPVGRTHF